MAGRKKNADRGVIETKKALFLSPIGKLASFSLYYDRRGSLSTATPGCYFVIRFWPDSVYI